MDFGIKKNKFSIIVIIRKIILTIFFLNLIFFKTIEAQVEKEYILKECVITATKTKHTLNDVPAAISVITKKDIAKRSIKTIQEALKYITGVKINRSYGWGDKGKVQLQGLDEKHTLVLVDGQKILGGHKGSVDLEQISIEMVERIEVVKGPVSALYGSDALGGVINIITKSPPSRSFMSGSTSFGSHNTQIYEISSGSRMGRLGYFLNYTYRKSDGINKETDSYWENLFQCTFQYNTQKSKLILKPYYSKHNMDYQDRQQERLSINSSWEYSPNMSSKMIVRGSWFKYKHWTVNKKTDWLSNSYEAEINYSRSVFNTHLLTFGYHYNKEDKDDHGKGYKAEQSIHSFFAQDEIKIEPVTLVLGLRMDKHDKWNTEFNPKLNMLYNITKNIKIRVSIGSAFKAPSLSKLYGDNWRMGPFLVHANPDLKPEKSVGYQIETEYLLSKYFFGKISFFRNDVKNLINSYIVRNSRRPPYDMHWKNVGKARTQGIELNVTSYIMKNAKIRLGYTFLDTEDKNSNKKLTYRPDHRLTMDIDYKIPVIDFNIIFESEYIGKRYNSEYKKLNDYAVFNFAVNKNFKYNIKLFGRINNIFGKKNIFDEYSIDGVEFLTGLNFKF